MIAIIIGKILKKITRIRGGGSALPGLFMERFSPNFMIKTLSKLPHGVVVVSGTNGKTTTTKMVAELLESQGLRVFTNRTGSNFVRGVASALLDTVDLGGNLPADIAVLELDEAHATHFVRDISPRYSLLLNVMRDQLDRFGEIDYTAKLLQKIGESTSGTVILNGCDSLLGSPEFSAEFNKTKKFGFSAKLGKFFPRDEEIHGGEVKKPQTAHFSATLKDFQGQTAQIAWGGQTHEVNLKLGGIHNILNMTAAVALVNEILSGENLELKEKKLISALEKIQPAFGRGEILTVNGHKVEIMLVKNPAGFRSNLMNDVLGDAKIMIAINDNYADGRDMSWLWDVDFSPLKNGVTAIGGTRAYDMALRLAHDNVEFDEDKIELEIDHILPDFLAQDGDKKIFATYTAMLEIRKLIAKITDVEEVL